jgi:HlyD family secretion protein
VFYLFPEIKGAAMKKFRNAAIIASLIALLLVACGGPAKSQFETVAAAKGSLSAKVGATGTVRSKHSAQLAWQSTGTVETINASVGSHVKKGDILAALAMISLPQNVILAQSDLLSAQQTLDNLQSSGISRAKVEQTLADAQKAFDDAKDKYDGIKFKRASDTYIDNTQANLDLANRRVAQLRKNYHMFENLPDGDSRKAESLAALTSAELDRDKLSSTLNYVTGSADATEAAQRQANYDVALANLENAKRALEQLKGDIDPVELASAQARVTAAQATLNTAYIIAPFDGTVTDANPIIGDQVTPGAVAYRLDDLSHLLVDVDISEVDINSIAVGQTVEISFDAIQSKSYTGKVSEVGQVGTVVQGAVNFTVTVELTDGDNAVKPGMTAAVTIFVKEIKDVLVVPNRAVRVVDGERVVYILKNNVPSPVKIQLGATSDTSSEVIGGDLKVGDTIVLNPPAAFGGGPAQRPGSNGGGG